MDEFIEQFLLESRDLVAQAIDDLLALEERPTDRERLDGAFRAFHTLKGAAGIVDFAAMGRMLHAAEDILASIRSSAEAIAPSVVSECLTCLDLTSRWLDAMQTSGETPATADAEADDMIVRLVASGEADEVDPTMPAVDDSWLKRLGVAAEDQADGPRTALRYVPDRDAFFRGHDPLMIVAGLPHLLKVDFALTDPTVSLATMDTFGCVLDIAILMAASEADVRAALTDAVGTTDIRELSAAKRSPIEKDRSIAVALLEAQLLVLQDAGLEGLPGRIASVGRTAVNALVHLGRAKDAASVEQAAATALAESSAIPLAAAIEQVLGETKPASPKDTVSPQVHAPRALRVDMSRIDALVKLAGELVVLKNAVGHAAKLSLENTEPAVLSATLREQHASFDRLTKELQTAVLRIRVLPLRSVFRRFPKLVREIAGSVGKTVRLVTEGDDTEADAMIAEALFEPLLHIVRNSIDHGIESSQRRADAGKPVMGTVVLRARRDADNVVIEVEDDGSGVDVTRVRAVAVERRIAGADALAAMTDAEAANLIFAPGFSTATVVTGLSGRGVGMDSVKSSVEGLGGRVSIETRSGAGTTISLVLPFSLMMTPVMTVEAAGQVFGLPLDTVLETTIVARELVVPIGSGQAVVLRDRAVPLIDLAQTLGLPRDPTLGRARIVVVSVGGQIAGLEVDRLGERMDVMLKPMDGLLAGVRGVAGTTLLGDGRVLIVLNVEEMLN